MKYLLTLLVILVTFVVAVVSARAQGFDCSGGFATSGSCGLNLTWEYKNTPFKFVGADPTQPKIEGTKLLLYPVGKSHLVANLVYQTKLNVQAFTTKFEFVPNGLSLAFNLNNANNVPGYDGSNFAQGAGCEGGFFQGYTPQPEPANNAFALEFDSFSGLNPYQNSPWDFSYSSVQIYQSNQPSDIYPNPFVQCPCTGGSSVCGNNTNPSDGLHQITKISTYPVPLNNPANTANIPTGDTYSATLTYDGSNLVLDLVDETKGGAHFTHTWPTDIPHSVNGDDAWVGMVATSNGASQYPLYLNSWTYSAGAAPVPTSTPTSQPTPPPSGNGNCTFTSPNGSVTWGCSQGASLSSSQFGGPGFLERPPPASPTPMANCQFVSKLGTSTWQCQ